MDRKTNRYTFHFAKRDSGIATAELLLFLAFPGLILAIQPSSRITGNIDSRQTFSLEGNTRPVIAHAQDQGPADAGLTLPMITMHLAMTLPQKTALLQLLDDQVTRGGARWHQWLTPQQYADRFGVNSIDTQKTVAWLEGFGFTNVAVARRGANLRSAARVEFTSRDRHTRRSRRVHADERGRNLPDSR